MSGDPYDFIPESIPFDRGQPSNIHGLGEALGMPPAPGEGRGAYAARLAMVWHRPVMTLGFGGVERLAVAAGGKAVVHARARPFAPYAWRVAVIGPWWRRRVPRAVCEEVRRVLLENLEVNSLVEVITEKPWYVKWAEAIGDAYPYGWL